jgi:nucleotide-binding universal stress UspA family protein
MAKNCPTGTCGITGKGIDRILLCVDGSPGSKKAAQKARDMALSFGAEVLILHVLTPIEESSFLAKSSKGIVSDVESRLYDAAAIMESAKVLYETKTMVGNAAEKILEVAENEDTPYDLIVLGSKGSSQVGRFLMGSVALAVTQSSRVPVLVVP